MGLFDNLMGKVNAISGAAQMAQNAPALKDAVLELLAKKETGGLEGLLAGFKGQDLSGIASSWLSSGKNMPISAAQITQALGPKAISFIAERSGVHKDKVAAGLTLVLPMIVDKLSPQGEAPKQDTLAQGLDMLKNFKI